MYVYAIETPTYLKIGRWSGTISALKARHAMDIPCFETTVFQTPHPFDVENALQRQCQPFHLRCNLFSCDALPTFYAAAACQTQPFCTSVDLENKKTAARCKKLVKENAALVKAHNKMKTLNDQLLKAKSNHREADKRLTSHKMHNIRLKKDTEKMRKTKMGFECVSNMDLPHVRKGNVHLQAEFSDEEHV